MAKELELWRFVVSRLVDRQPVMLLVVAESTGSSPGRVGYKMAVGADGEMFGSIGGGAMEVRLIEQSMAALSVPPPAVAGVLTSGLQEQIHQMGVPNSSGLICSGKQTVILKRLDTGNLASIKSIIASLENRDPLSLTVTSTQFHVEPPKGGTLSGDYIFERVTETDFRYEERVGPKNNLYIIGGGHCALALSELMSRIDFHVSIFDDRADLNTIEKNPFADEIRIIDSYENIGELIPVRSNTFVVVMTIGYKSDEVVIRALFDRNFKYFGVLGSKAKMKTLLTALAKEGFSKDRLTRIRTPIGLAINSQTPEEIAISIAAEIISVKNS